MRRCSLVVTGTVVAAFVAAGCGSRHVASGVGSAHVDSSPPSTTAMPTPPPPSPSPSSSVVPWVDEPADPPSPSVPAVPSDVPLCNANDVVGRAGGHGVGLGSFHQRLSFSGRPGVRCALRYGPLIVGVRADGTTRTLSKPDTSGYMNPIAIVSATADAYVDLAAGDACDMIRTGRHDAFTTLRVTMPGGGATDVAIPGGFDAICKSGASYFTSSVSADPPSPALTADLPAPANAIPGSDLTYAVTLTNASTHPVSLDPCPTYTEFLTSFAGARTTSTQLTYRLNCAAINGAIPAGQSLTFAMRLAVPPDQPAGAGAKLGWTLNTDETVSAGAIVPVEVSG